MRIPRESLLENWGLKITALLVASILWLLVHGDSSAERIITVPLEIRLPRNMEVTSDRPSTVEVTVRGASGAAWFSQPLPTCTIDIQNADEGIHIVPLNSTHVRIPRTSGLEVVSIRPARISLVLERTISRDVPVRIERGDPPLDLDVYGMSVAPSTVRLLGPRSHVLPIRDVSTEVVGLAGHRESFVTLVNLDVKDPLVHLLPSGPVEVRIELGIHRKLQSIRSIPILPDNKEWIANPRFVTASVLVPITYPGTLTAADFVVTVPVLELRASQHSATMRPEVKLKDLKIPSLEIKEVKPSEVTVRRMMGRK